MKRTLLTFTASLLTAVFAFGQGSATDFFFGYKKSSLSSAHKEQLSKITQGIDLKASAVKISAYCDSVGGEEYNVGLGQARADLFVQYFKSNGVVEDKITVINNGSTSPLESNATEAGREQNRRVIVEIFTAGDASSNQEDSTTSDTAIAEVAVAPCSVDTMVHLNDGAWLKMNVCEYNKYKDCMTVKAFNSLASLKNAKYTTMNKDGEGMSTGGIIDVRTCSDAKLDSNLTVYVPINEKCKLLEKPDVWTSFQNDVWNNRSQRAEVDTIEGNPFYVFTTKMSGTACFGSTATELPEFQVKGKKGLKIKDVKVYYGCELGVYHVALDKASKKVKIKLPCPSEVVYFDIEGVKKDQDIKFTYVPSSDIKTKCKQKGCDSKEIKRKFYIYPPEN